MWVKGLSLIENLQWNIQNIQFDRELNRANRENMKFGFKETKAGQRVEGALLELEQAQKENEGAEEHVSFGVGDAEDVLGDEKRRQEAEDILKDPEKTESFVQKIMRKLKEIPLVGDYFADVPALCMMVKDYASGDYTEIPLASVIGIMVALLYFLSPIDLIPDVIPAIGLLDDAVVISFAVHSVHDDIVRYRMWKGLEE